MGRYRGYTDALEVMIDVLDELRAIKELLTPKEIVKPIKEVDHVRVSQSPKGKQRSSARSKRSVDKPVV